MQGISASDLRPHPLIVQSIQARTGNVRRDTVNFSRTKEHPGTSDSQKDLVTCCTVDEALLIVIEGGRKKAKGKLVNIFGCAT